MGQIFVKPSPTRFHVAARGPMHMSITENNQTYSMKGKYISKLHHLMYVIARAHTSTRTTSLMCAENSMHHFCL